MSDTTTQFFPLDFFLRHAEAPDPQGAADATGLTIICDEDAAAAGADCWHGTLMPAKEAVEAYAVIGGTVSAVYAPIEAGLENTLRNQAPTAAPTR